MKTYSFCKMVVDGKEVAKLDIYKSHNTFEIFEHDFNVYSGSYGKTIQFVEEWKANKKELRTFLEASGHFVSFEQTI